MGILSIFFKGSSRKLRKKPRKIRSDARIKTVAQRLGLEGDALRNPSGRKSRSDKKLGTLRKDWKKKRGK